MKNYINLYYDDTDKLSYNQLREVVIEAWNAVPNDFLDK